MFGKIYQFARRLSGRRNTGHTLSQPNPVNQNQGIRVAPPVRSTGYSLKHSAVDQATYKPENRQYKNAELAIKALYDKYSAETVLPSKTERQSVGYALNLLNLHSFISYSSIKIPQVIEWEVKRPKDSVIVNIWEYLRVASRLDRSIRLLSKTTPLSIKQFEKHSLSCDESTQSLQTPIMYLPNNDLAIQANQTVLDNPHIIAGLNSLSWVEDFHRLTLFGNKIETPSLSKPSKDSQTFVKFFVKSTKMTKKGYHALAMLCDLLKPVHEFNPQIGIPLIRRVILLHISKLGGIETIMDNSSLRRNKCGVAFTPEGELKRILSLDKVKIDGQSRWVLRMRSTQYLTWIKMPQTQSAQQQVRSRMLSNPVRRTETSDHVRSRILSSGHRETMKFLSTGRLEAELILPLHDDGRWLINHVWMSDPALKPFCLYLATCLKHCVSHLGYSPTTRQLSTEKLSF